MGVLPPRGRFGTINKEAWRFENLDDLLFYHNHVRPHQSPDYGNPMEVFFADLNESQWSPLSFH